MEGGNAAPACMLSSLAITVYGHPQDFLHPPVVERLHVGTSVAVVTVLIGLRLIGFFLLVLHLY